MEVTTIKAKKNRSGNFSFSFPAAKEKELDIIVLSKQGDNVKNKTYNIARFAGKLKTKIDWAAYQKQIRSEWD